jgi:NAD-dependent dihydropyrimidine dehydrogenase PreA subunit
MKILKATFPKRCIGCELCVFAVQRQLKKIGLEDSLIRIFKKKNERMNGFDFFIEIDSRVNQLDINKIRDICPSKVFEIVEGESHEFNV